MPREPPVTSATLPARDLVIGFLRRSNSETFWICISKCVRNRNYRNTLFLILRLRGRANGKTSGFRGAGDFRKSRGITIVCGSRPRAGAVQGHGIQGGHPARGAALTASGPPHFAAPCL